MPFSSVHFLQFKWWRCPGLDCAIWVCQKKYYNQETRNKLVQLVANQSELDWSAWLLKLFHLGHPNIFQKIHSGCENLWITDLTIAQSQRSGAFPRLFQGDVYPEIAGITIKKVLGSDRPNVIDTDLTFDVILTLCPAADECPTPILHRQHIPHWTNEQKQLAGRYTTGPLFTHWTKI